MRDGLVRRAGSLGAAFAIVVGLLSAPTAEALKSVAWTTSGKSYSCSVTAVAPTLDTKSRYVTISSKVVCTVSVSVTVTMRLVEMDGTLEDSTNLMDSSTLNGYVATTLVGSKGYTFTYTIKRACVSTDSDNEEYATKASIAVFANSTAYASQVDRTVPKSNQYGC